MHRIKKLTAIILSVLTVSSVFVFGSTASVGASGTGAGLAEWALNAYYEGWSYVYGGSSPGAVDCSGLIYSYCGGERVAMIETCTEQGSVSAGVPNIHGLGLWRPGHVGVYVGNGYEVDARGDDYGVCYEKMSSSYLGWTYWFKLAAVSYVENGWEEFNGDYYYYENGEYITDTSRTIGGTTYYFDDAGRSSETPSDTSSTSSSTGSTSSSTGSSSSDSSSATSAPTTYQLGSSGDEVTKIQMRLKELGYFDGEIDGNFGTATEAAYKAFQLAAGLTVDGIAGSDLDTLYSEDAPKAQKTDDSAEKATEEATSDINFAYGSEGDKVGEIQSKLKELGYYTGEIDKQFGYGTTESVTAFQLANGIEATGVVDEATYSLMFSDSAVANPNPVTENPGNVQETTGPVQLPSTVSPSALILTNEQNQTYADTASDVVIKTNKVTQKALSKSSSVAPAVTTAKVKRTANIWIWFVLVAIILGVVAFVFFMRDRKGGRYARYCAKKKKTTPKAEWNSRW